MKLFFELNLHLNHFRSTLQHIDSEAVEIGVNCPANRPARSNPMQMPTLARGVPVLIESGSASKFNTILPQICFPFKFIDAKCCVSSQ